MILTNYDLVSKILYSESVYPNTAVCLFLTEWNTFRSWSIPFTGPNSANDASLDLQR